ncbi:MAG: diphthine--ammonia ligase [Candidatus Bathyarchaeota archaeon]|nr:diphthine--ammonia ligase [Candidatus Bathyarchaeota archaeon]
MKIVASWSGGKDSCFALYKALKENYQVMSLLTFMCTETKTNFHGLNVKILDAQAQALGISLVKTLTKPETYEQQFKAVLHQFKVQGVEGLLTGDIYEVAGHEERWLERVCKEVGLQPIRPLWMGDTKQILQDFINAGFEATVVRTKNSVIGEAWLGRQLNQHFLQDILKLKNVDPCGEGGEYHTVVTDGPIFKNRLIITETKRQTSNGYGHLEIVNFTVTPKTKGA